MFTTNMRRSDAIPQSFNRYAYVGNDPVNMVDPSGLEGYPNDEIRRIAEAASQQGRMSGYGPPTGGAFGWSLSPDMAQGEAQYMQRVTNAFNGQGFFTNAEVYRSSGVNADVTIYSGSLDGVLGALEALGSTPHRFGSDGRIRRYYDMRSVEDQSGAIITGIVTGAGVGAALRGIGGAIGGADW